jgi:hypothetical protein
MRRWVAQPVPWGIFVFTILLLGVAFGAGVAFAIHSAIDSHDAKTAASRQAEGRAVAIDVLCGFGNGVAEAGRKALAGELVGQHSANGLPAESQRDYVATITSTLLAEAGISARDVVQVNGTINCPKLRVAARAPHP